VQSFRHSSFCIVYIRWGGLSNTFIYLFYLKTSKPQNLKTSKPQNLKTSLCSITTVSVSYADTFSFRSKVNTLKPRSAREKEKAAF